MTTVEKVEQWVIDRNLHTQDPKVQMCKTMEELGELEKAINKTKTAVLMHNPCQLVIWRPHASNI